MRAKLKYHNEEVELDFGRDTSDGSISLRLQTLDGRPFAKVTVSLFPDYAPPEDCIVVRNYSENAGMLVWLHAAGIIADEMPIDTLVNGLVEFPVCKLSTEVLAAFHKAETEAIKGNIDRAILASHRHHRLA